MSAHFYSRQIVRRIIVPLEKIKVKSERLSNRNVSAEKTVKNAAEEAAEEAAEGAKNTPRTIYNQEVKFAKKQKEHKNQNFTVSSERKPAINTMYQSLVQRAKACN